MNPTYLTEGELAAHWNISPRTLQRWRLERKGPNFVRIGRCIRYRLADALAFEDKVVAGGPGTKSGTAAAPIPSSSEAKLTDAQEATLARLRKFLGTEHLTAQGPSDQPVREGANA